MSKVTVVGAGNVGATCANVLAFNEVADEVVMLDVKEGVSEGKAMDMMQTAQLLGFDTTLVGCTNDYAQTANSDVVVITSGIPRKPGMTREELIGVNAGIVKSVAQNILKYSPNAILVVISNPMDTMTYLSLPAPGLPPPRNRRRPLSRRRLPVRPPALPPPPARQSAPNRLPVRNLMLPLPYKPRSHEMVLEIPPRL